MQNVIRLCVPFSSQMVGWQVLAHKKPVPHPQRISLGTGGGGGPQQNWLTQIHLKKNCC